MATGERPTLASPIQRSLSFSARLAGVLAFALLYYLLGVLSYRVAYVSISAAAAWWAPSGLALATFLRTRRSTWPWLVVGIFAAVAVIDLRQDITPAQVLFRSIADCAEPLCAAWLLRSRFPRVASMQSVRDVLAFSFVGGLVGPLLGALIAGTGRVLATPEPFAQIGVFGLLWVGSASLGVMLFAPALLTTPARFRPISARRLVEVLLLGIATILLSIGGRAIGASAGWALVLGFAAFPVLTWAAVRFGTAGAARTTAALSLLSVWSSVAVGAGSNYLSLLAVQSIYALAAFTALTLAALTSETRALREQAEVQANRAEETLALLDAAIRSAPFGFAFFDRDLRIARLNDVFASTAGRPAQTLYGLPLAEAAPEAAAQLEPLLRLVFHGGEAIVSQDLALDAPDQRHWLCSAFPVRPPGRAMAGVGLLMVEISDRISAERERAALYQQAEEAIRLRDEFLSIASHELKTPLTPLVARLYMIRKKLAEGERVEPEMVDKTLKSVRRLTDLINDLLDVSRIVHGGLTIRGEPLLFGDLIRSSAEAYRDTGPEHRLEVEIPPTPIWVRGDAQRLMQVFTNLLDNAFKYSPAGGKIRVRVTLREDEVDVSVSDEGIGIPEAYRPRLFDRFFRAPNASLSYGGLGLGLYITRDIVDRHGGRIWAESGDGGGSTFHVVLPVIAPAQIQQALH